MSHLPPAAVAGFVVVRRPDRMAEDLPGPRVEPLYHGCDRLPWWELTAAFYAGTLSPADADRWRRVKSANADRTGLTACPDLATARHLLAASNHPDPCNQLVAVESDRLRRAKGEVPPPAGLTFLGFDVFAVGYWSLLKDGFHKRPDLFADCRGELNEYGLFHTPGPAAGYVESYNRVAAAGGVEDVPTAEFEFDVIAVWAVPDEPAS